jgi:hypothetical protein
VNVLILKLQVEISGQIRLKLQIDIPCKMENGKWNMESVICEEGVHRETWQS